MNPDSDLNIKPENKIIEISSSPRSGHSKLNQDLIEMKSLPPLTESEEYVSKARGFKSIDLSWENLNIQAKTIKKEVVNGKQKTVQGIKTIINNISGSVRHGRFTAIMGPSGRNRLFLVMSRLSDISSKN